MYTARLQGSSAEGLPLVRVTIMLLSDEATSLAREGVVNGERLAASAAGGKACGGEAKAKKETVLELLRSLQCSSSAHSHCQLKRLSNGIHYSTSMVYSTAYHILPYLPCYAVFS